MDSDFDPDPADGDEALAPPKGLEEPKVNADALVGELSRAFSPVGVLAKEKAPGVENMIWQMRQCRLDLRGFLRGMWFLRGRLEVKIYKVNDCDVHRGRCIPRICLGGDEENPRGNLNLNLKLELGLGLGLGFYVGV